MEQPSKTDTPASPPTRTLLRTAIAFEGSLVLVAWALGWLIGQPPLAHFHGSLVDLGLGLLIMLPMFGSLLVVDSLRRGPLMRLRKFVRQEITPLFRGIGIPGLLAISLLAGVGEEMLFRGVIQDAVARYGGSSAIGLIAASILFGLAHAITRTYAILAGLIGLYLGAAYLASGNLLVPIVAHAAYDFLALVYLVRDRPD